MNALLATLLLLNPIEDFPRDRCDVIEVNHFFDGDGCLIFDQEIFYDWCRCRERFDVRAWRLVKSPHQLPERDWQRGGYVTTWQDGEIVRRVQAASIRETWTQYDPELAEREYLCKEKRRELTKPAAWPR